MTDDPAEKAAREIERYIHNVVQLDAGDPDEAELAEIIRKHYEPLVDRLREARTAIASLDAEALGVESSRSGNTHRYLRDELLANIDKALAQQPQTTD